MLPMSQSVARMVRSSVCWPALPLHPGSLAERPQPETSRQPILINTPESEHRCVCFASEMGCELIYQHLSSIIRSPQNLEVISPSRLAGERQDVSAMLLSKS